MTEIVIAGGGTGGHLFPGLAVAAELRRTGAAVSWLGARGGMEAVRVPAAGIPIRLLAVSGAVARSRRAQATAAFQLLPALVQALIFLMRRHAAAVLAVGGYASVPGALAAGTLGLPVVLQEQNACPGAANRLLAPWSVAVGCGFAEAVAAFPSLPARWTGNPVREEFFSLPAPRIAPLSILVMGGSQGSAFLNAVLPDAFAKLANDRALPRIVHQAGARRAAEVRERYAERGVLAEVTEFLDRPAVAMADAALVIARAGALTIAELAAVQRAALLVPFAAAAHGHQLANARAFAATGAAEVVQERDATATTLAATLTPMLATPERLIERGRAGGRLARPDAATAVARLVLENAGGEGGHP